MDHGHQFRSDFFQGLGDLCRLDDLPPGRLDFCHSRAAAFGHIHHARAENAVDADDDLVARFNQVDETKFHARAARAADRERHVVLGQENRTQHGFDFLHHLDEDRIKMANERLGHGFEHGRSDIAGARSQQETRRRLKGRNFLHGTSLPAGLENLKLQICGGQM